MATLAEPPPVLKLAALKWVSDGPEHFNEPGTDGDEEIGQYVVALPALLIDRDKEQEEEDHFTYTPRTASSHSFTYQRKALTDYVLDGFDGFGCILGQAEQQGPRFNLCLPGEPPFPFSFKDSSKDEVCHPRLIRLLRF